MSKKSLARFWKKVEADPQLLRAVVDLAAKHGFTFTAGELGENLAAAGRGTELSEAELGDVAGGGTILKTPKGRLS